MNSTSNFSWAPTAESDFNFTDCENASKWTRTVWRDDDVLFDLTIDLILGGLSSHLNNNNIATPERSEVELWYLGPDSYMAEDALINFTLGPCYENFCSHLGWQGNSDLAGRGMFVNYSIQAAISTLYFVVLAFARLNRIPKRLKNNSIAARVLNAFQHSTRIFIDTTILFALAMLGAALYTLGKAMRHPEAPLPKYISLTTSFLPLYTIFPALVLHCSAGITLRRTSWRRYIWGLIACLAVPVIALYFCTVYKDTSPQYDFNFQSIKDPEHQLDYDVFCLDENLSNRFRLAVTIFIGILLSCSLLFGILVLAKRFSSTRFINLSQEYGWFVIGNACVAGMWACLGVFFYFRKNLQRDSGDSNKDFEWSFGQVLGLVTWVPVLVEFIYIFNKGPEEALTGQMMEPFEAVSKVEADLEKTPFHENSLYELTAYKQIPS